MTGSFYEIMKKLLLLPILLMFGCATVPPLLDTGIQVGVTTALSFVKPSEAEAIAGYVDTYAGALRTITADPPPSTAQLIQVLNSVVPPSLFTKYPQLRTIEPLIVTAYQLALSKYGQNSAAMYAFINSMANDLEVGAAPYLQPRGQV